MSSFLLKTGPLSKTFYFHLYCAIGLMFLTLLVLRLFSREPTITSLQTRLQQGFPLQVGSWKGTEDRLDPRIVTALGVDDWMLRRYENDSGAFVWLYIGFLQSVRFNQGRSHHSPQVCYPAQGWEPIYNGLQPITLPDGQEVFINKLVVQKGLDKQLILYWQQQGNTIVAEKNWDKGIWGEYGVRLSALLEIPSLLMNKERTDRALIRISAPVTDSVAVTLAHEIAFIRASFPILASHFSLNGSSGVIVY